MDCQAITGIVLSGGSGRDFSREDKGWALWQGHPMIEHCIEGLRPQVDRLLICCNRHHERYAALEADICQDERPVFQGPLAAVEAGLKQCRTELALLYPSDSPAVPVDLVKTLLLQMETTQVDVVYVKTRPVPQYLIALLKVSPCLCVSGYLDNGGRSVREWYEDLNVTAMEAKPEWGQVLNINDPEQLV